MSFDKNGDTGTSHTNDPVPTDAAQSMTGDSSVGTDASQQHTIAGDSDLLQQQIEVLQKEKEEYVQLLQRERADFINFKKRVEEERKEIIVFGQGVVLMKLLPLYEQFERSFGHVSSELEQNEWVQGIRNIKTLFEKTFHDMGVERVKTVGTSFDSSCHEAMMQVSGDQGMVISELEAGYLFKGKVIKAARVSVGNGVPMESEKSINDTESSAS